MRRHFFPLIGFFVLAMVCPLTGQNIITNTSVTGVCYAGKKVTRIYIPPPEEFFKKSGKKGGGSITFYYAGFTSQAKAALEYAATILESMLPADTRITVQARWENISTPGVLGSSSITGFAPGWIINALNPEVYYPIGLAEKIAGTSLNTDLEGDITLRINSSINWYLGTDGKTPITKYDLVTIVLHEICHGLGFYDSMNTDGTVGYYGIGSKPMIYDTFIENLSGKRLTDTSKFDNFSTILRSELTSNNLFFNGPLLKNYSFGGRAKLYAPSTWDEGSSISHLDEDATLQENALMTPFVDLGEAIHNPGKYTFSILADLGWINTRIIHTPSGDTEQRISQISLSAQIKSDTLFDRNKVGVVYSFDNFLSSDTLFMTSQNSDNIYNTIVNIPSYNSDLHYYFFAQDCFLRLYTSPSLPDLMSYRVYVGTDTSRPVITHTPATYYLQSVDTLKFNATVRDNLGLDTVYLEYKVNDGPFRYIGLKAGKTDNYSAFVTQRQLNLKGGDSISYRIIAIDSAKLPNTARLPESGNFVIHIEKFESVVQSYSTDFNGAASDFFNIGFSVMKPDGFSKYGLHTKHPYESPELNNASIEYTSMLRHPFSFKQSGLLITFDEVVLVEPGEPGSLFGSADFYDYVILDGSKDLGKTWFNLIDGYDSRLVAAWDTAYNSSIIGQNSTYIGTEAMLKKHTIYYRPSQNVSGGDTLLLRFRLYSDPFANGWGWVIEDLKINPLIDAIENAKSDSIVVYPNPGRGLISLRAYSESKTVSKPVRFSVYNSAGLCLIKDKVMVESDAMIDISQYPSGIYIIVLNRSDGIKTIKYSLIK